MNTTLRRCAPAGAFVTASLIGALAGSSTSLLERSHENGPRDKNKSSVKNKNSSDHSDKSSVSTLSISSRKAGKDDPRILFLGTGSSTGCPKPLCSLAFPEQEDGVDPPDPELRSLQMELKKVCRTSRLASWGDPRHNKNYRNNPSLLIMHRNNDDIGDVEGAQTPTKSDDGTLRNVIIDVGKTFREGSIRWMPQNGVRSLDAIVLTHEHADAMLGLDDVRGFQRGPRVWNGGDPVPRDPMSVFLSKQCFDAVKRQFFYLVPKDNAKATGQAIGGKNVLRAVSSLQYHIIEPFRPFVAGGIRMIPLPVLHGEDLVNLGFAFTIRGATGEGTNVVYLSDISRMPKETEGYIAQSLPPTDVLVVDTLLMHKDHPVHFSMDQALELAKRLKPRETYLVGMNCDDFPPHDEMNKRLSALDLHVRFAHDGLVLFV